MSPGKKDTFRLMNGSFTNAHPAYILLPEKPPERSARSKKTPPGKVAAGASPAVDDEKMRDRKNTPLRDLRTYGHERAPRLEACDYAGDEVIHLTLCAAAGAPFKDASVAQMVCSNIEHYSKKLGYCLYGYCLMPDHLHVLLSPGNSGQCISRWLQAFKSYTGHEFKRLGGSPPLWQRSAYDHVCRKAETADVVMAYIAENSERAGFVHRWDEWPYTRVFVEA